MFAGEAKHWWNLKKETLHIPTIWDHFLDAFHKNFFLMYVYEKKEEEI